MASLNIPDSLLTKVLSNYPLANPRIVDILEASKRNYNYLIEDKSGKRYVLRRYRRNPQEARVRFQLSFQEHLVKSGFPTSEIIRTVSNDLLIIQEKSPWALFTFIKGTEYDFSRVNQTIEAARRLAEFHTITRNFRGKEFILDISHVPDWWENTDGELAMLDNFFYGKGVDSELASIREHVYRITQDWPLERNDTLPFSWVHGDYHGRNIVFVGDKIQGLFDFDCIHHGYRVEDVSTALYFFGRPRRGAHTIRTDIVRTFLAEYTRNLELQPEELEAIPTYTIIGLIPSAAYFRMLQRDDEDTIVYMKRFADETCAIRDEMQRLAPVIREFQA